MSNIENNYTSRDFESIYSELLDNARLLATRWNPSQSNESDPGVVLLKLGALLADKANYAVDQGLLQLFPTTVSQRPAAEALFSSLGYQMRWYQSAVAPLEILYSGPLNADETITLPKYDTKFTSDDGKYVYSLIGDDITFYGSQPASERFASVNVIEGAVRPLDLGGEQVITLHNLDNYNRVYFTESMVAQNGVFVWSAEEGGEQWTQVDSVYSQDPFAKVYKFGTTSSGGCYLEFPTEIASIIGSGLRIYYTVSSGAAGNINMAVLTKFYGQPPIEGSGSYTYADSHFRMLNPSGTTGGSDPQSIDDAYQSYLRAMGTFSTLVSERDYESYIYNLPGPQYKYWVSNVRVNDRTDDLTYSTTVKELDSSGQTNEVLRVQQTAKTATTTSGVEVEIAEDAIQPYEIRLRSLEYVENLTSTDAFNETFDVDPKRGRILNEIARAGVNLVSLKDKPIGLDEAYIILNKYNVTGTLYLRKPLTDTEGEELLGRVRLALFKRFNARQVTFGVPVNLVEVHETIEAVDPVIERAVLTDLQYVPYVLTGRGSKIPAGEWYEDDQSSEKYELTRLLARLVVSGSVQLFDFEPGLVFRLGTQTTLGKAYPAGSESFTSVEVSVLPKIESITTESVYTLRTSGASSNNSFYVRSNDNVVFEAPSFISTLSYASYIPWKVERKTAGTSQVVVKAGQIYQVGESLNIFLNKEQVPSGSFLQPSFDWTLLGAGDTSKEGYLAAGDSVDVVELNSTSFKSFELRCMWFLDQGENVLFASGVQEVVLQEGQWFVYKLPSSAALHFLGAGTLLRRSGDSTLKIAQKFDVNVQDIEIHGDSAVDESVWYQPYFDMTFTEQDIITLGEGAWFLLSGTSDTTLSNTSITVSEGQYQAPGGTLQKLSVRPTGYGWKARSRLNLNASTTQYMKLVSGQSLEFNLKEAITLQNSSGSGTLLSSRVLIEGSTDQDIGLTFSHGFSKVGGDAVDLQIVDIFSNESAALITAYVYNLTDAAFPRAGDSYDFYGCLLWQVTLNQGQLKLNKVCPSGEYYKTSATTGFNGKWKARFRLQAGFAAEGSTPSTYTIDLVTDASNVLYYGEYYDVSGNSIQTLTDSDWNLDSAPGDRKWSPVSQKTFRYLPFGLYGNSGTASDRLFKWDGAKIAVNTEASILLFVELRASYWTEYGFVLPVQSSLPLKGPTTSPANNEIQFVDLITTQGGLYGSPLEGMEWIQGQSATAGVLNIQREGPANKPAVVVPWLVKAGEVVGESGVYAFDFYDAQNNKVGSTFELSSAGVVAPRRILRLPGGSVYSAAQLNKYVSGVQRRVLVDYINTNFPTYNLAYQPKQAELIQGSQEFESSQVSESSAKPFDSPYIWDPQNLLSGYTLPCLDTDRLSLSIANSSKKGGR